MRVEVRDTLTLLRMVPPTKTPVFPKEMMAFWLSAATAMAPDVGSDAKLANVVWPQRITLPSAVTANEQSRPAAIDTTFVAVVGIEICPKELLPQPTTFPLLSSASE